MPTNPLSEFLIGLAKLCKQTGLRPAGYDMIVETDKGLMVADGLTVTPEYASTSIDNHDRSVTYDIEGRHLCNAHGCLVPCPDLARCAEHTDKS